LDVYLGQALGELTAARSLAAPVEQTRRTENGRKIMAKMDDAWKDVAEQLGALGSLFEENAEKQGTDEELEDAVSKFKQSLQKAAGTAGDTVKDPELKERARKSAESVLDAIGTTFSEVGEEISKR
jgi:gas vesicle protein